MYLLIRFFCHCQGCAFVQYTDSANAEKAIKQLHGKVRNLNYFLASEGQSRPESLEMLEASDHCVHQKLRDSTEKRETKIEAKNTACDL